MQSSVIIQSSKPFPNFIRGNNAIESNLALSKIFPSIGLPNAREPIELKLNFGTMRMDRIIHLALSKFISEFNSTRNLLDYKYAEQHKITYILFICNELCKRLNRPDGVLFKDDFILLKDPIFGYDKKIIYKTGTDICKLAKSILLMGSKYIHIDIISPKEISRQCKDVQVVFSSADIEGAWDLATMSMRGVKSCMRWESSQALSLTGSIIDPYCGIIYITNGGKTNYGSKMLFRSLVRLLLDGFGEPVLMVDRLYSCFYKNKPKESNEIDAQVKKHLLDYLKKKLPKTTIIDSANQNALNAYRMPRFGYMNMLTSDQLSYRDTQVEYSAAPVDMAEVLKRFALPEKKMAKIVKPRKKAVKKK